VCSVVVVVGDVFLEESSQMEFAEDDDVVEQFASDTPDPTLGDAVLPRTAIRRPRRPGAE